MGGLDEYVNCILSQYSFASMILLLILFDLSDYIRVHNLSRTHIVAPSLLLTIAPLDPLRLFTCHTALASRTQNLLQNNFVM